MTSVHSKGSKPKVNFGKVWTACLSTLNLGYYNGCWYFKHFHQVCECISLLSENIFLSKLKRYFDGRPLNSGKSVAKLAADAGGLPSLSPPSLSPAQNCISATIMNDLGIYFYLNWKHISKGSRQLWKKRFFVKPLHKMVTPPRPPFMKSLFIFSMHGKWKTVLILPRSRFQSDCCEQPSEYSACIKVLN